MKNIKTLLIVILIFIITLVSALYFRIPQKVYNKIKGDTSCRYELQHFNFHYEQDCAQPKIIMLGNSLIRLGEWKRLLNREDVINRGITGDFTECICQRLKYLKGTGGKIWFIEGGINDINANKSTESILDNYIEIIDFIKKENAIPIITLTLHTNVKADERFQHLGGYKKVNIKVDELNNKIKDYANKNNIIYIDLNSSLCNKDRILQDIYTTDGVHLTPLGYEIWKGEIIKILQKYNI